MFTISIVNLGLSQEVFADSDFLVVASWNVRGYPEKKQDRRDWFQQQLKEIDADVICIQEIANREKVDEFINNEEAYTQVGFQDSSDGQDNAIFATDKVTLKDIYDPHGFQHPVQAVYISYKGFDAVVITVHLSWTDKEKRKKEKLLLKSVVSNMLQRDPDVIIVGDFNTKEEGIQELADSIGMSVMIPPGQNGIGTTHAGNRYDHFLISSDLADEEALTTKIITYENDDLEIAKKVSDHLPIAAEFKTDAIYKDREGE